MNRRRCFAASSALTVFLAAAWASGACRTTTCDRLDAPPECLDAVENGCSTAGKAIAWPGTCVSTSVSAYGSPALGITADDLRSVVRDAFSKWTSAACATGAPPQFVVDIFPDVRCQEVTGENGYKEKGPNYNIWIFQDTVWPYESVGEDAIAITTTQFSPTTGEIYDSDVELNSKGNQFTIGLDHVVIDLPSVVLHEAGHFLGLAHSTATPTAVMNPTLDPGDYSRRQLDADDILGICSIYTKPLDASCDPEPRHGFSTECEAPTTSCSITGRAFGLRGTGGAVALLLGLLGVAAARRRR